MIVTRFAPSPTGHLHLGHVHSALLAWTMARTSGGKFLLRIEDIDFARCRNEFAQTIQDDLNWLGIDWDGPVVRQSERLELYQSALGKLRDAGLVYPCFCTRKDILTEIEAAGGAPHSDDGPVYPGLCKSLDSDIVASRLAAGKQHAWRLDMAEALRRVGHLTWHDGPAGTQECAAGLAGDVVLGRKDIGTSYHLAVTIDDASQGITRVVRGTDLFSATHIHRVLQALLDLPTPDYHHHRLITDRDGQRLAKRDNAWSIRQLVRSGITASEVRKMAGFPDLPAI